MTGPRPDTEPLAAGAAEPSAAASPEVRPLRVVHVVWSLAPGGIERLVVDVARGLDRSRFDVQVVTMQRPTGASFASALAAAGVPVHTVHKRSRTDLTVLPRLAARLVRLRPDVLQTHDFGPNLWGRLAGMLAGVPVLLATEHMPPESQDKSRLRVLVDRLLAPHTRTLIAVSRRIVATFVAREGIDPRRILYLPNGVDVERHAHVQRAAAAVLGWGAERVVAIAVGGLHPRKDHATLLRAVARARTRQPRLAVAVVGDGGLREPLERLARELGLAADVRFLGYRHDVPELLAAADVYVQTSRAESCSLALLEAMAAGLPPLATPVGDTPAMLGEELAELTFPVGDVEALADGLVALADDVVRRVRLGTTARRRVRERHDLSAYLDGLGRLYEGLVREAGAATRSSVRTSSL